MKKVVSSLMLLFGMLVSFQLVMLTSCEGPEGPAGPQGPVGGDGSVICGQCHNLTTDLQQKITQYEYSIHATGGTAIRSTSGSCARCHSHEGFLAFMETGAEDAIAVPLQPNCRTCHPIHETYTVADYAVSYSDPFVLDITETKATFDIGLGNLCSNCHQPRTLDPEVTVGGPDVNITSYRWGYHHGPQAALYVGEGGYRILGSMTYPTGGSKHMGLLDNGCVDCHMAPGYATQSGGHTWNMRNGSGAANMAACTDCHSGATSFDILDGQTEIEHLLDSLKTLLTDAGIYGYNSSYIYPGTYSADDAGCYLNFQFIEEDRSLGVHNLTYAKALLTNSIEHLAKKK